MRYTFVACDVFAQFPRLQLLFQAVDFFLDARAAEGGFGGGFGAESLIDGTCRRTMERKFEVTGL